MINEENEDSNYVFNMMYKICAQQIFEQNAVIHPLNLTKQKEEQLIETNDQILKQKLSKSLYKMKEDQESTKLMYYNCFNRFFYAYNIIKRVGYEDYDEDENNQQ